MSTENKMKILIFLAVCALFLTYSEAKTGCQNDEAITDCTDTEYHTYISCVSKRMKRSLDCDNSIENCTDCDESCTECDCDYCTVNSCESRCNSCCPHNPPCTTNRCCHRTCHARCRSSTCRTECRRSCGHKVNGTIHTNHTSNVTIVEKKPHNITTVINLHNVVNNTHVIDVPVHVNSTHINNISMPITTTENPTIEIVTRPQQIINQTISENCCHVVSPRQCVPKEQYPYMKCFHYRRKICGPICKAPIIHEQPHEICDQTVSGTNCHQQIIYIPQPQPRCNYQPAWPYVACGAQQIQSCAGCYVHYGLNYPQMPPMGCSLTCYDDGYGSGPYYRQGPFYRPGYAHVPSCYQTGTCGIYGYEGYPAYSPPSPYGGAAGFPGLGYPPYTYENSVHIETNPSNVVPRAKENISLTKEKKEEVEETLPTQFVPMSIDPQYTALGYPYVPQFPPYYLPPEVDIQASITHPEKEGRYAQITITDKRETDEENGDDKELDNEIITYESEGKEEIKEE